MVESKSLKREDVCLCLVYVYVCCAVLLHDGCLAPR